MKKTFLTLVLLFIANFSIAQDASNDATWEETIDFISENLHYFDLKQEITKVHYKTREETYYNYSWAHHIEKDKIKVDFICSNHNQWGDQDIEADLKNLTKVELINYKNGNLFFDLSFLSKAVTYIDKDDHDIDKKSVININLKTYWYRDEKEGEPYKYSGGFNVTDEIVQRMYKAFQHLAYLAGEKRKQSKF